MTNNENERAAYAAGDMVAADLYHRLDQLTRALGEALAELTELNEKHTDALAEIGGLKDDLVLSNNHANELQRELDKATP